MIKTSDWIVDMGPEGGAGGGTVVATGTPEDVAANTDSYTGHFLAEALGVSRAEAEDAQAQQGQRLAARRRDSALRPRFRSSTA